jgi:hypothetical protein
VGWLARSRLLPDEIAALTLRQAQGEEIDESSCGVSKD